LRLLSGQIDRATVRTTLMYRWKPRIHFGVEYNPLVGEVHPLLTLIPVTETQNRPAIIFGYSSDRIGTPKGDSMYRTASKDLEHGTGLPIAPYGGIVFGTYEHRFRPIVRLCNTQMRHMRARSDDIKGAGQEMVFPKSFEPRKFAHHCRAYAVGEHHLVAVHIKAAVFGPVTWQWTERHFCRASPGRQGARIFEIVAFAPCRSGIGFKNDAGARGGLRIRPVTLIEDHSGQLEPATGPAAGHTTEVGVEQHGSLVVRTNPDGDAFVGRAAFALQGRLASRIVVGRRQKATVIHFFEFLRGEDRFRHEHKRGDAEKRRWLLHQ